mmetsp:Transcript_67136/g.132366  ORF Transcript_67136/g.132366 Transcript_67136/m.132366 type:complete len:313 (-) Transcript_67136:33-971(-)
MDRSKLRQPKDTKRTRRNLRGDLFSSTSYMGSTHIWTIMVFVTVLIMVKLPLAKPNMHSCSPFFSEPARSPSRAQTTTSKLMFTITAMTEEKDKYFWSTKQRGIITRVAKAASRHRSRANQSSPIKSTAASRIAITYPMSVKIIVNQMDTLVTNCAKGPKNPGNLRKRAPRSKALCFSAASTSTTIVKTLIPITPKMAITPGTTEAPAMVHGRLNMPVPRPPQIRLIVASRTVVVTGAVLAFACGCSCSPIVVEKLMIVPVEQLEFFGGRTSCSPICLRARSYRYQRTGIISRSAPIRRGAKAANKHASQRR